MSFVLLMITLFGFDLIADQEADTAARTHYQDIANRVASVVLTVVEVGVQRAASSSTADTSEMFYQERLRIPTQIRAEGYRITLDEDAVTVAGEKNGISETAELFNLIIGATCTTSEPVCELGGEARSVDGVVLVKYEFKKTGGPSTNCPTVAPTPNNCITLG